MEKRSFWQSSNPRRLTPVLFFACLVVAAALVATMAQGQQGPPAKNPAGAKQAQQTTGWLILDGRLIPGPYEVSVEDTVIKINGLVAIRAGEEKDDTGAAANAVVDSATLAVYNADKWFWSEFRHLRDSLGHAEACARAVRLMLTQQVVDTAYLAGPGAMLVRFKGRKTDGIYYLDALFDSEPVGERQPKDALQLLAKRIEAQLRSGSLVLVQSGRYRAITRPRAEVVLNQLLVIAKTEPSFEARLIAMRKLVGHDEMARAIAGSLGK